MLLLLTYYNPPTYPPTRLLQPTYLPTYLPINYLPTHYNL